MSEKILNISVTSDSRELFTNYELKTIKKIKETALNEINNKKTILRNFIGDNYRPLLETPPVLQQIQNIFEESQKNLKQIDKLKNEFMNDVSLDNEKDTKIYSKISCLYLSSIENIKKDNFLKAISIVEEINEIFKLENANNKIVVFGALKFSVDFLPKRIFKAINEYIANKIDFSISKDNLKDCYEAIIMLFEKFPSLKNNEKDDGSLHLNQCLKDRILKIIQVKDNITDILRDYIQLIEEYVEFLYLNQNKSTKNIFSEIINCFLKSIESNYSKFKKTDLTSIIKVSKEISDISTSHLEATHFVMILKELGIKIDFWKDVFLPVFQNIASISIDNSVKELKIEKQIKEILINNKIESYNGIKYVLSQNDLKSCSLGIPKSITVLQVSIDQLISSLLSKLQLKNSVIGNIQMLRTPVYIQIKNIVKILKKVISKLPLSVYLLSSALCTQSIKILLGDDINSLIELQNLAGIEWAKSKLVNLKLSLNNACSEGCAFKFLFNLENEIIKSTGHMFYYPINSILRKESSEVVYEIFKTILDEKKYEKESFQTLFYNYSLLSVVLKIENTKNDEILLLFKQQYTDDFEKIEKTINENVDETLSQSGELFRLISGSVYQKSKTSSFNVVKHLNQLFKE